MPSDPTPPPIGKLKMVIRPLHVEQGVRVPWLYGYSYYDAKTDQIVAYVIPLNIIVVIGLWLSALFRYRIAKWFARRYERLISQQPK